MIRVLLADDQQLVRAGLRMLCEAATDIEVVAEAGDGAEAERLVHRHAPDVVLMDLSMPGTDGVTATGRIAAGAPASRVLVLTTFDDDDHLYPALTAGAHGFLAKDAAPEDVLDGIRRTAEGDPAFSPSVLRRLVLAATRTRQNAPAIDPDRLTPREREVFALVGEGLGNAEIAARLHLGVTTVKTHVSNLITKTGATGRVRLAVLAARTR